MKYISLIGVVFTGFIFNLIISVAYRAKNYGENSLIRERVIRIFPNEQSAICLIGSVLIDINEEWQFSARQYIKFTEKTKSDSFNESTD